MTLKNATNSPFLRVQRQFPDDNAQVLSVELDKTYIDISQSVNKRTIGIFPKDVTTNTGESWYLQGGNQAQQGQRQVYTFTSAGNIAHGLTIPTIPAFIRIFGAFTDGTNWYPLPYVDTGNANNQVAVKVTPTNIVITAGGGSPPSISNGTVVLEWLASP